MLFSGICLKPHSELWPGLQCLRQQGVALCLHVLPWHCDQMDAAQMAVQCPAHSPCSSCQICGQPAYCLCLPALMLLLSLAPPRPPRPSQPGGTGSQRAPARVCPVTCGRFPCLTSQDWAAPLMFQHDTAPDQTHEHLSQTQAQLY